MSLETETLRATLADITKLVDDVRIHLVERGFVSFRVHEMLNHDSGRHFRAGYAGGEWTITVSQRVGHRYEEVRVLRLDCRTLRDRALPTPQQLAGEISR